MKLSVSLLVFSIISMEIRALSLILQNLDPYCLTVQARRDNEIKLQYMVSGLNEEQVEFRVSIFQTLIYNKATMARSDELLHSVSGQREHETSIKVTKEGQVRMCWRKLDRKSKKLNFSFQINDKSMNNLAGQDTIDVLNQELSNI